VSTVLDVAKVMELLAPLELAESYDNPGLQVGSYSQQVKKVFIALDMDCDTLSDAKKCGADMIITHHPHFFSPIKRLDLSEEKAYIASELIKSGISLYSAHTNLDSADGGVNDELAKRLGLCNVEKITADGFTSRMGETEETTLLEFAKAVKEKLGCETVRFTGEPDKKIKKVALCGGSGAFLLDEAKENGCDVLVAGEAKYNHYQHSEFLEISLVEAGHFETENIILEKISEFLLNNICDIETVISKREKTYYKTV